MQESVLPWEDIKTRGLTLIQFKRYLVNKFGIDETDRIIETLPRHTANQIKFPDRGAWYEFEIQRQLREAIISRINPSDPYGVIYNMGLVTSSWDFSGFLKPIFSFIPLKTILKQSASLWSKYYDKGNMKVARYQERETKQARLELYDFPSDPLFCPIVTSWMMTALNILKLPSTRVEHTVCIHKGSDLCRFDLYWE